MRSAIQRIGVGLTPPIVADVVRWLHRRWSRWSPAADPGVELPEWEMVANCECLWAGGAGWSHKSIVETQVAKWPEFLRSVDGPRPFGQAHEAALGRAADVATHNTILTFGYALGRAALGRAGLSVLDWGGGLGHYYVYARRLFPELSIEFTIKDLPDLCAAGESLMPDAKFVDDDVRALSRRYDFVFASSSIHYSQEPYALLRRLCDSAAGWIMITRTPIVERSDDFIVVQRPHRYGYFTEYPGWVINRTRLINEMNRNGFVLDRQFLVGEQPNVPNAPEQAHYYGFLFCRT